MPKQQPRLLRSALTGQVYVVTRYTQDEHGNIVASTKYDVTEDFWKLANEATDAQWASRGTTIP